ncbi:TPA: type VI secretion system tube protein TssD [Salmonella enterica subsp. salamae serovar 21:z10:[z6]]|uniref:type VI secretion system tube protein TssD n=1 Tax=Salmonella enterica TaxID=28901 RepID=UPI001EF5E1EC|nr:type VI secretion system tube protein TssD [Salmonella enterica]
MSDIVYLTVIGEQQGAISAGCGTESSVGNRWQIAHEDEIFVFSLSNSMTSTGKGSQLHGLRFCKLIDKSTPLFTNAINNNEQLYMEFYFYRINRANGRNIIIYSFGAHFYQIFSVSSVKIVYLRKPLTSAMNISYANISLLTPNSVIWRCPKITTACLSPSPKNPLIAASRR